MNRLRRPLLVATVALLCAAAGCDEEQTRPQEPRPIPSAGAPLFHPPTYPVGRSIDTIVEARLAAGRTPMFVVASRRDSGAVAGRFDLVEVYGYDSTRRAWGRVLVDSADGARGIELADVTGDGHVDIVVPLAYGGNDPISSNGMHVYSAHGAGVRRIFRSTWMDPRIDTLPGVEEPVITVRRALWPLFAPRADALPYVDDVFGYRDGRFRSIASEARTFFAAEADRALATYRRLRDSIGRRPPTIDTAGTGADTAAGDTLGYGTELALFRSTALVVFNRVRAGDERAARSFWNAQRGFLRSVLREEHFDELDAFCRPLITVG